MKMQCENLGVAAKKSERKEKRKKAYNVLAWQPIR